MQPAGLRSIAKQNTIQKPVNGTCPSPLPTLSIISNLQKSYGGSSGSLQRTSSLRRSPLPKKRPLQVQTSSPGPASPGIVRWRQEEDNKVYLSNGNASMV